MSMVKWVMPDRLIETSCERTVIALRRVGRVPVIPLSALPDVVEGLRLALDYYRSKDTQKFNPYEVEQRLEKILAQLEKVTA